MSKVVKAVTGAISGVAKAVGSVVSGVVNAVGSVVSSVINFVVSPFLGLFGMNIPSPDTTAQSITGVTVQRTGTAVNVPVLYGYRQVGGAVTFAETGSDNNKYLWVAYTFTEGSVEGLHDLFIDDIAIPAANIQVLNTGASTTITDPNCKYYNALTLQWYCGYYVNNPIYTNVGPAVKNGIFAGAPSWTTDMAYNGLATLFARYEWKTTTSGNTQSNVYGGSIPVVKANIMGRRVTSLVSGSPENTEYGDYINGYTERYSTNPAEILLDYLRNPWYGKGLMNSQIDFDSFKRAAAKCNTEVTYTTSGVKGPILTLNYVTDTSQTIFNNVKDILANFRGYLPYVNGRLTLVIEDAGHPTDILSGSTPIAATFDRNNIQGDVTYTGIDLTSKYNVVTVNYCDPDQQWTSQTVVYPPTADERNSYLAQDGYRENKGDFTFKGITNYAMAYDLARLIFNKSRLQDTINLTVSSQAFELQPGDSIYVNANILQFGTDPAQNAIPWRIISIKLNNDYTFTLGCVRNPNYIYPYTKTTDRAYNLGVFIPQGATRYYPVDPGTVPVGLNPPTNAVISGSTVTGGAGTNYPVTLPPTNPTGSTGGGVGSSTGSTNSSSNNNTTPTTTTTTTPLNDVIGLKTVTYNTINQAIYADVTFIQPSNAAYSGVSIWWKRQIASETVWSTYNDTQRPGSNVTFAVRIGPLVAGQPYMIQTRVHYGSQGDSTNIGYESITPQTTGTETPTNYVQGVTAGWTLNSTPNPNTADVRVGTISGNTLLTNAAPRTPRAISFSVVQAASSQGQNVWVNGLIIYYRNSSATYWNSQTVGAPANYVPGTSPLTFTLDNLGVPSYPNAPTSQAYDFVIRYTYSDGRATTQQYRAMSVNIERNAVGSYSFDAFSGIIAGNEAVSNYTVTTVDQAPPGAVTLPADITIGLTSVETYNQVLNTVRFFFSAPATANQPNWYGVRFYYRPVTLGDNPAYQTLDITPANRSTTGEWSAVLPGIAMDQQYQIVIVPLVTSSSGMAAATNCWWGQGSVNTRVASSDYPANNNFMALMKFTAAPLTTALNQLTTTFPLIDPVAQVLSWTRNYVTKTPDSTTYNDFYYQLQVQVPTSNFNELRIYRREMNKRADAGTTYANYFGQGRWELITITTGFDSQGRQTINLRPPVGSLEFNCYYNLPGTSPYASISSPLLIDPRYTDALQKKPTSSITNDEFLLVLKCNNTVSTQAIVLPKITWQTLTLQTNGLITNSPRQVAVTDYNTYISGYQRNLTDARSSISIGWFTPSTGLPIVSPGVI